MITYTHVAFGKLGQVWIVQAPTKQKISGHATKIKHILHYSMLFNIVTCLWKSRLSLWYVSSVSWLTISKVWII